MQSWGVQSRFTERDTCREPTKSGIIGLLCAALGISRENTRFEKPDNPLREFESLGMGVRVEREGILSRDYHTAGAGKALSGGLYGIWRADGSSRDGAISLSSRYYLSDAEFYVALEGNLALLEKIALAVVNPHWPLYLGRKSFLPAQPVFRGVKEGPISRVIIGLPWRKRFPWEEKPEKLRLVLECSPGEGAVIEDVPLSFAENDRRYSIRHVKTEYLVEFEVIEEFKEEEQCTSPG
jgi:CRISPR system Cascade subunit CasD